MVVGWGKGVKDKMKWGIEAKSSKGVFGLFATRTSEKF